MFLFAYPPGSTSIGNNRENVYMVDVKDKSGGLNLFSFSFSFYFHFPFDLFSIFLFLELRVRA